jgi:hypothetical protein
VTVDALPEHRASRVLPAVVIALFVLVGLPDVIMVAVSAGRPGHGGIDAVEVSFSPGMEEPEPWVDGRIGSPVADGAELRSAAGELMVERAGPRVTVRQAGLLVLRFRVPDAGSTLELGFRFIEPANRGRCEITVGRVASRYGVDVVRRLRLAAVKRPAGTFRHNLADHVGWFEIRFRINRAAARGGFELTLPRLVRP